MKRNKNYYIRKTHRYLGLFLGLQFIAWTVGGLYFSWSNMDEVHGDHQKKHVPLLSSNINLISPLQVIDSIKSTGAIDSIVSVQLIQILGTPHYQVKYTTGHADGHHGFKIQLADATTGKLRMALTEKEAIAVAVYHCNFTAQVDQVEYLTETGNHHEYRESKLPAFAIHFNNENKTTVYVAAELGTVQKFRNNPWRIFDFLWMMHTMDYQGRDNIGNILLKVFSILGLVSILSGFVLFYVSSPTVKKTKKYLVKK